MPKSGILVPALALLAGLVLGGYFLFGNTRGTAPVSTGGTGSSASPAAEAANIPASQLVIEVGGATSGTIVIELRSDIAPKHVDRISKLAREGRYDNVVFHRVIGGFMAQTGDVQFGKRDGDTSRAGMGASALSDLDAEFSDLKFVRGTVGMARSASPDSANSQFFIMFAPAANLNGQYTVVGQVIEGMDVVDAIQKGDPARNGAVSAPDFMASVTVRAAQ